MGLTKLLDSEQVKELNDALQSKNEILMKKEKERNESLKLMITKQREAENNKTVRQVVVGDAALEAQDL